jgi:hypothetical protein
MIHGVSVEGLLAQANFGRKSRKFEEIKETPENGERDGNKIKVAPKIEEIQHRGKSVTKWTNYCGAVGKWTSIDLESGWIIDQPRLSSWKVDKPNPLKVRYFARALSHFVV